MIYLAWAILLMFSWFLPWWWVVAPLMGLGFLARSFRQAVTWGSLSLGLLWPAVAYFWDLRSYGLMSQRISGMLSLPSSWWTYLVVAGLGALLGVTAALSGYFLQRAMKEASPEMRT